jgi:hypothetical protein
MLNAVLNNDTSKLMEMRHLLHNQKYTKLWGKLYTKELRGLAQGVSGAKGTDTIVFIKYGKNCLTGGGTSRTERWWSCIGQRRMTQIARGSRWVIIG